jgi:hypothetical protein
MILKRGKMDPVSTIKYSGQLPLFRRGLHAASNAKFYAGCFECCDLVEVSTHKAGEEWLCGHECDGRLQTL